jgi:hypothetical protein
MNITPAYEDPTQAEAFSVILGENVPYVFQLIDTNGTAVDVTTGTLTVSFTNNATGASYTFPSGTSVVTKSFPGQGVITVTLPSAWPTTAVVRVTVTFTNGAIVRLFGPTIVTVVAP